MFSKTSNKVKVTVYPYFLENQSSPNENHYVWAYKVNIFNNSDMKLKLDFRNWTIIDAEGRIIQIQGEGVVGEFPQINPGEIFEYTSGTPLKTSNGIMQGFYIMSQTDGKKIKIDIPAFSLDSPYHKKNIH